jgi:hypothetical protein
MEAQKQAGYDEPPGLFSSPTPSCFLIDGVRQQDQGSEDHPVGCNDEGRGITEFDENGSGGDSQDPDGDEKEEGHHISNLYQLRILLKLKFQKEDEKRLITHLPAGRQGLPPDYTDLKRIESKENV